MSEITLESEPQWQKSDLWSAWCGTCRWGAEGFTQGQVRRQAEEHNGAEHDGQFEVINRSTRRGGVPRFIEQ